MKRASIIITLLLVYILFNINQAHSQAKGCYSLDSDPVNCYNLPIICTNSNSYNISQFGVSTGSLCNAYYDTNEQLKICLHDSQLIADGYTEISNKESTCNQANSKYINDLNNCTATYGLLLNERNSLVVSLAKANRMIKALKKKVGK